MTDTSVVNPNDPIRMAPQGDVDAWRQSTPVPPPPGAPPGMKDELAQQQQSAAALAGGEQKYQHDMGPLQAGMKGAYQDLSKATANTPPQQPLPPRPDAKEYEKNSMAFASAMAVLGAVTSHFGRANGTQALSAFAGALNGWKTGNLERYEADTKKWEQDTKATIETNRQLMQKYQAILDSKKLNIDGMAAEVALVAAENHHDMMYQAAKSQNYTLISQIKDKMWEYTEGPKGLDLAFKKMSQPLEAQRIKNQETAAKWSSLEGQQELNAVKPDGTPKYDDTFKANVKRTIDLYGGSEGKGVKQNPQQLALERYLEANPNATGEEIQKFNSQGKPPRSAAAMSLAKYIEENPQATSEQIQQFQAKQSELSAAGRTKGGREANLDIILNVTDAAIPAALAASDKVPRGKWVPLNQIIQKGSVAQSDPATMQFGMANLQLAEGWARAMNPTGVMRESDRDKALSFLSTATSKETYKALVEQLRTQIQRERNAIQSGKQSTVSEPGSAASPSEAGATGGWGKAEVVQ